MEKKNIITSRTIIGILVALGASFATKAGYDIGDQNGLINNLVELFGSGLAIYGRFRAVKKIGIIPKK